MPVKFNLRPNPIHEGDWVYIKSTKQKGVVVTAMDQGERLLIKVPRDDDWPFPKHVYAFVDSVRKCNAPKFKPEPIVEHEEGLL